MCLERGMHGSAGGVGKRASAPRPAPTQQAEDAEVAASRIQIPSTVNGTGLGPTTGTGRPTRFDRTEERLPDVARTASMGTTDWYHVRVADLCSIETVYINYSVYAAT